jgi:hypothetical protein
LFASAQRCSRGEVCVEVKVHLKSKEQVTKQAR